MPEIIEIGFSPCPNDTFIFDALVNKKINTQDFVFKAVMEDVETLNQYALQQRLPITKLSYGVFPMVLDRYALLDAGSALGRGVGPLLIRNANFNLADFSKCKIAIPGEHTTAHLLFTMAYPELKNKVFLRYDEIEEFVLKGHGLGVIIHENRFTYQDKGLEKMTDLGEYWETKTGQPIPLGGIVIDKRIDAKRQIAINQLIRESIEYAYLNYPNLPSFVRENSQEMSEAVMRQHIDLYVNKFSLSLTEEGRNAIQQLLNVYMQMHNIENPSRPTFIYEGR